MLEIASLKFLKIRYSFVANCIKFKKFYHNSNLHNQNCFNNRQLKICSVKVQSVKMVNSANASTQCGNPLTVDEENVYVMVKSYSPVNVESPETETGEDVVQLAAEEAENDDDKVGLISFI